jgi:hypothetical protein
MPKILNLRDIRLCDLMLRRINTGGMSFEKVNDSGDLNSIGLCFYYFRLFFTYLDHNSIYYYHWYYHPDHDFHHNRTG